MCDYIDMFESSFKEPIEKYNRKEFVVGIDASNGATYKAAEEIFNKLGINYKIINNNPDGININHKCRFYTSRWPKRVRFREQFEFRNSI